MLTDVTDASGSRKVRFKVSQINLLLSRMRLQQNDDLFLDESQLVTDMLLLAHMLSDIITSCPKRNVEKDIWGEIVSLHRPAEQLRPCLLKRCLQHK